MDEPLPYPDETWQEFADHQLRTMLRNLFEQVTSVLSLADDVDAFHGLQQMPQRRPYQGLRFRQNKSHGEYRLISCGRMLTTGTTPQSGKKIPVRRDSGER